MFRPLNKNVLVKALNLNKSNQSIFMGKSETPTYEVVGVGDFVSLVKVGDVVYLNEDLLVQINTNNETYYLLKEEDIYMVVEK